MVGGEGWEESGMFIQYLISHHLPNLRNGTLPILCKSLPGVFFVLLSALFHTCDTIPGHLVDFWLRSSPLSLSMFEHGSNLVQVQPGNVEVSSIASRVSNGEVVSDFPKPFFEAIYGLI